MNVNRDEMIQRINGMTWHHLQRHGMRAWYWAVHSTVLRRRTGSARAMAVTQWRATLGERLITARASNAMREAWELSRALACTGQYARRRWRGTSPGPCPPIEEWKSFLKGGGKEVGNVPTHCGQDRVRVSLLCCAGDRLYWILRVRSLRRRWLLCARPN